MKPEQKDGSPIYPNLFSKLLRIGKQLEALGYVERGRRPNLFVREYTLVKFYADLGGTSDVALWEDHRPLFYWFFARGHKLDLFTRQRMVSVEWFRLARLPKRLSYDLMLGQSASETADAEARFIIGEDEDRVLLPPE